MKKKPANPNTPLLKRMFTSKLLFIIFTIFTYTFFTAMYMGPSTWHCADTLYGFGDNTAGPIWRFELEPKQPPLGSISHVTNAPVGEDLYTPANYSQSGQAVAIWATSRILGPICGYNFVNVTGFIVSALAMFGFVYSLTKRRWIAWLAGYAVSFSTYYQMKVGGHPGYGYQALLIGVVWAFYNLTKKCRRRDAVYLAAFTAACFYFDPYFSLLAVFLLGPLIMTWLGILFFRFRKNSIEKKDIKNHLYLLLCSGLTFLLLLSPLVFVTLKNGRQISSTVAAVRGNVVAEAKACSNLPYEYLIPPGRNYFLEKLIGRSTYTETVKQFHDNYSCGIGEDTVGISLSIVTITSVGLIVFAWERLNKRSLKLMLRYDTDLVILGMIITVVCAMAIALPPVKILGVLPTPAYILLAITTTWRTLTRLYVDINIIAVTLFSIVLVYFSNYFKKYRKLMVSLFIIIFLAIFIEYLAFKPFTGNDISTFSYKDNVPTPYVWLHEQNDIKTIAEFPIEKSGGESNAMAYYLTMQNVHKKKLFNGNVPTTYEEQLRSSLKDISDPQTVEVLGSIGVDTVVIHGVGEAEVRKIDGLEVVYTAKHQRFNMSAFTPLITNDNVVIARVRKSNSTQMMLLSKGFVRNATIIKSAADWNYEALNNSEIKIIGIPGKIAPSNSISQRCFSVRMAGNVGRAQVTIIADDLHASSLDVGSDYIPISVTAKNTIVVKNNRGYNMQIRDLGCKN